MKIDQRVVVAPVAGFVLGFLDFVWIKYVPSAVAGLGNSVAVWAVAAFLLTYFGRGRVAGAVIMLVVAVPSYYLAAALIQHDNWSNIGDRNAWLWAGLAVIAGVVFGLGGMVARRPGRWRLVALGLPAAVLLAEAILTWSRLGDPDYRAAEIVQYALILTILAIAITVALGRTWRDRALALTYAVPLAAIGYLLIPG